MGKRDEEQVKRQLTGTVGEKHHALGFCPHYPVAVFNALGGNVLDVAESERKPEWAGCPLWVDDPKVASATPGSAAGPADGDPAATLARWKEELLLVMDADNDGTVDPQELLLFLSRTAQLQDDALIDEVKAGARGKTLDELLAELGPSMPEILSALAAARWEEELLLVMDADRDGTVAPEELLQFLSRTALLQDDAHDDLIDRVKAGAEGKTLHELLAELGPCMPKILSALVAAQGRAGDAEGGADEEDAWEASTEYARHMQLRGGYKDPDGIRVRARRGLAAMECLAADEDESGGLLAPLGAALMLPVTRELRSAGYVEGANLRAYGYDWRVPCTKLEERDRYLSETMTDITDLVASNDGRPALVVAHSLGGVLASYFFAWVAHSAHGKEHGGVGWLETHVRAFLPIGGPMLGTPHGSHAYLAGDAGLGLSPRVFSHWDQHLVVRSWGACGMLFPSGRHLELQPTRAAHWVRRQGCLRVHVVSASVKAEAGVGDEKDRQFYVTVGFREPTTGKLAKPIRCTSLKMRTEGAVDERLQFYWDANPETFAGAQLMLSFWRDRTENDKEIARGTFTLGETDVVSVGRGLGQNQTLEGLPANTVVEYNLSLLENTVEGVAVKVMVKLEAVPFSDDDLHGDFRSRDAGAARCGGAKDDGSSPAKRERLLAELGAERGTEWRPECKPSAPDPATAITYAPMGIDEMMVLDRMRDNYNQWKECYAGDPLWRRYSTEPPEGVRRIRPIYGINVPTVMGSVFKRINKRDVRYQPNTSLELDANCAVSHPDYRCTDGVVEELPNQTPQADDPTLPVSDRTFGTNASGDGTVAYWSLRWPITWEKHGYDVQLTEVDGAGHRDVLDTAACLDTVLREACAPPVRYLEITLDSVTYKVEDSWRQRLTCCQPMGLGADAVFVELKWRDRKYVTESVVGPPSKPSLFVSAPAAERDFAFQKRFVLGVAQEDLDQDQSLRLKIKTAAGKGVAAGTKRLSVPLSALLEENKGAQVLNMGDTSDSKDQIEWHWRWFIKNDKGKLIFDKSDGKE